MKNKENYNEISLKLGMSKNGIYMMRSSCNPRFKYIDSLKNGDFYEASRLYRLEMNEIKSSLVDIYYELADDNKISDFGKYLVEKDVYKHNNSFGSTICKKIFNSSEGFRNHNGFLLSKRTVEIYGDYKKERESS